MNNNITTTFLGKADTTSDVGLGVPYDPDCFYNFEFQPVTIGKGSNGPRVYLFCGCGVDNERTSGANVWMRIYIQQYKGNTNKQKEIFNNRLYLNNLENPAGDSGEKMRLMAYFYWRSKVEGGIPLKYWNTKSSEMFMRVHVISIPSMGFFGGKFRTNDDRHSMKITTYKYEYDKIRNGR